MKDPIEPKKVPGSTPPNPPAHDDGTPSEQDLREGTIDFNLANRPAAGGSDGAGKLHKMSEPISGGSIVSWAELLRQQQRDSNDEVTLGSLPEIQIDAMSDKDIVRHLEREAQSAARKSPPKGPAAEALNPPAVAPPMPSGGSLASKLFKR